MVPFWLLACDETAVPPVIEWLDEEREEVVDLDGFVVELKNVEGRLELPPTLVVSAVAPDAPVGDAVVCRVGDAYVGDPVKDVSVTAMIVCARPGLIVNAPPFEEQLQAPVSKSWPQQNLSFPQAAMSPLAFASSTWLELAIDLAWYERCMERDLPRQ